MVWLREGKGGSDETFLAVEEKAALLVSRVTVYYLWVAGWPLCSARCMLVGMGSESFREVLSSSLRGEWVMPGLFHRFCLRSSS